MRLRSSWTRNANSAFFFPASARVFARESGGGAHGAQSIAIETLKVNVINLRSASPRRAALATGEKCWNLSFGLQVLFDSTDRWAEYPGWVEEVTPNSSIITGAIVAGSRIGLAQIQNARSSILMQEHRLDEGRRIQRDIVSRLREHMSAQEIGF